MQGYTIENMDPQEAGGAKFHPNPEPHPLRVITTKPW